MQAKARREAAKKFYNSPKGQRYRINYRLKKFYGITTQEYEAMYRRQGGLCALCGEMFDGKRMPAVDHDHRTGKIRGLLHIRCNVMLGCAKDKPGVLIFAAEYLERHGKPISL